MSGSWVKGSKPKDFELTNEKHGNLRAKTRSVLKTSRKGSPGLGKGAGDRGGRRRAPHYARAQEITANRKLAVGGLSRKEKGDDRGRGDRGRERIGRVPGGEDERFIGVGTEGEGKSNATKMGRPVEGKLRPGATLEETKTNQGEE